MGLVVPQKLLPKQLLPYADVKISAKRARHSCLLSLGGFFHHLKYRKLKASYPEDQGKCTADNFDLSLLSEAWKPVSMGYKRRMMIVRHGLFPVTSSLVEKVHEGKLISFYPKEPLRVNVLF